jgi:hypothetical protein
MHGRARSNKRFPGLEVQDTAVRDVNYEAMHKQVYDASAGAKLVFFGDLEGNSLKEFPELELHYLCIIVIN